MLRTVKPKNARSKRALEAREPKEVEDPRTVIFVKGTHTGERLNTVMKDLMALKRPYSVSFSKKNTIRPFEDHSSLEFWALKNDASIFVVGQNSKKRPDNLTFARIFDNRLLDMCEVGVENIVSMEQLKTPKSTPGHKPLMHFSSELFDSHPRYTQLKTMLMDLFNGQVIDSVCLSGLEHVISVTVAPDTQDLISASSATLPTVHVRTYTFKMLPSGVKTPRVELTPMGPHFDLVLRRNREADEDLMKAALKRSKIAKKDTESGLGKKRKNLEVDEMGDLRGRVHVGSQSLDKLQRKKVKALRGDDSERVRKRVRT
ncbi:Brix domain-containing protein [Thelephora terrestris]|uniref:Ribosome production factor 2 homolog n=1 Tax=Thelephora terrestris TaxID=56493 RepID=A0A9P6HCK3_9AGAM|nr:Brix domain-containing protein [Thelephora terrestris]